MMGPIHSQTNSCLNYQLYLLNNEQKYAALFNRLGAHALRLHHCIAEEKPGGNFILRASLLFRGSKWGTVLLSRYSPPFATGTGTDWRYGTLRFRGTPFSKEPAIAGSGTVPSCETSMDISMSGEIFHAPRITACKAIDLVNVHTGRAVKACSIAFSGVVRPIILAEPCS
jgi:hypothetical protein